MSDNITSAVIDATGEFDKLVPQVKTNDDKVWCKIGADGTLELFDWEYAEATAREYDALDPLAAKSNAQIICKLAVLLRAQTVEKCQEVLGKFARHSQNTSAVIIKDPLEGV